MTLYEQILELFPLVSYEQNRKESGHVAPAEETDRRELTKGVTYRKCRYRRGDGKDVWVYLCSWLSTRPSTTPLKTP